MFIFERQRDRLQAVEGQREREREGDTEAEAGSRYWAVSLEPQVELEPQISEKDKLDA